MRIINRTTCHILKQVEWYFKLKEKYGCDFVAMEYTKYNKKLDVYGITKNGEEYLIEVGSIKKSSKEMLKNLAKTNKSIHFLHFKLLINKEILPKDITKISSQVENEEKSLKDAVQERRISKKFAKYGFFVI